jgi:hypothetical protein
VYDDNLFNLPARDGDAITRAGSAFDAGYRSERRLLTARYALDADRFARHPELTSAAARQDALVSAGYHANRRLSFDGTASFADTQTPAELNLESGLAPGRAHAQRFSVRPSTTASIGPLATATISYTGARDHMFGVNLVSQTASAALDRHASTRADLRWEYTYQRYVFNGGEPTVSQALTAEWRRSLTRATLVVFRAGPRMTGSHLSADAAASVNRTLRFGAASLAYSHTQTTLVGLIGVADKHAVSASLRLHSVSGRQLRIEPAALRTRQLALVSTVYRVSIGYIQPLGSVFALDASYDINNQRGNIYTAAQFETIGRHVAMAKLVAQRGGAVRR